MVASVRLRVARTVSSDWNENTVTFNTRPRALFGDVSTDTSSGVALSNQFNALQSTAVNTTTDVLNIYNSLPTSENQITFAVTINSNARDFRLTSKEGAGSNLANWPRLILGITAKPDYRVLYDLNGGTGIVLEPDKEAGVTFAAAGTANIVSGPYGFPVPLKEWNTSADGSGTSYAPGAIITMPEADMTLYAIWDPAAIDAKIIIAAYNDVGKLIAFDDYANAIQAQDLVNGLISNGAKTIRAFLWDSNFIPLAEAKSLYTRP